MKRMLSFIAAISLALGGVAMVGCDVNDSTPHHHDADFGGGSGEFGTSAAVAGDYSNHANPDNLPATQPSQIGQ